MKYRGFDTSTRPLRWGLYGLTLAAILVITGPGALNAINAWLSTESDKVPWYATRLFGMLAYWTLALSVAYGLLLSSKLLDAIAHRAVSFTLHQDLAAIGLALSLVHGAVLSLDHTVPYNLAQMLIPFAGPYRPVWVGVGQVAFYLSLAVYFSFNVRRRIGQRAWRLLHYATFAAYLGATAHGLMSGTDTSAPWAFWSYAGSGFVIAFLFAYRITASLVERWRAPVRQGPRQLPVGGETP
jgi:hypothetical protein